MAVGGRVGADGSPGLSGPLLTSAPSLPYVFAPPEFLPGAIDALEAIWLMAMGLEMIISGWLRPIG